MHLYRVTITGADNSVSPEDLRTLSARFPFVEWGILLSQSQMGSPRFPPWNWLRQLRTLAWETGLALSAHLCGRWVRAAMQGDWNFLYTQFYAQDAWSPFQRLQFNFHGQPYESHPTLLARMQTQGPGVQQVIFQADGVNESLYTMARAGGIPAALLFDASGGTGQLPDRWPPPFDETTCGYAGGLSSDNVVEQIEAIAQVCGDTPIWIDVETHVRSENDRQFDLGKAEAFLEAVAPFVTWGDGRHAF